jgi:formylglycine-generating enzyme required for sulfatase activity
MVRLVIHRQQRTARYFTEDLGNGVGLDMILVPGGSFRMGSPSTELAHKESESPRHLVTVPTCFVGRYPVTQAQWRKVARLPKIERTLKSNPSHFKGDQRPVEHVSWHDAVEFCDRLSRHTERNYRLPTEAEWEYACRAGTTTPFHFGETITTDLANYRGTDWEISDEIYPGHYGRGDKGIFREETTDVGSFPANAFGLRDMHGNVWEWCLDHWHDNYEDPPTDGSAWLTEDQEARRRVLRGGTWVGDPWYCRSAYRLMYNPDGRLDIIGFRVVCVTPRTP